MAFPQFAAGSRLRFEAMSPANAAYRVLSNVQNLDGVGARRAVELASELAARCACHTVVYDDAREAAVELQRLIVTHEPAAPRPWRLVAASEPARRAGPSAARGVIAACFADGALLMHEASGRMLVTDAIGSLVWPLLNGRKSSAHIASELAGRCFDGTSVDRIARDFDHWIAALVDLGFVDHAIVE